MITIHHNFDETKFKWLWAKYVKAGNIEKHCTACLIGPYSKKFSGSSNHNLLEQSIMTMDEVPDGQYEAIYFCGVLKKGYLNKNPLKNNYPHNVHFAVCPADGEHDVWDFENWHVEIENGKLERIPETYELSETFFRSPYNSHYYTCRIFRWMVGHFFPQELIDPLPSINEAIELECLGPAPDWKHIGIKRFNKREFYQNFIEKGKRIARNRIEELIKLEENLYEYLNEYLLDNYQANLLDYKDIWKKMCSLGIARSCVCELINSQELDGGTTEMFDEAIFGKFNCYIDNYEQFDTVLSSILLALGVEEYMNLFMPYMEQYEYWNRWMIDEDDERRFPLLFIKKPKEQ